MNVLQRSIIAVNAILRYVHLNPATRNRLNKPKYLANPTLNIRGCNFYYLTLFFTESCIFDAYKGKFYAL